MRVSLYCVGLDRDGDLHIKGSWVENKVSHLWWGLYFQGVEITCVAGSRAQFCSALEVVTVSEMRMTDEF